MKTLYTVLEHINPTPLTEAAVALYQTFDAAEAERVKRMFNDEVQGDLCTVFDTPLIDNYGHPFPARDLPVVFPTLFASFMAVPA